MGRSTSCLLMELLHFRWLVLPRLHWGGGEGISESWGRAPVLCVQGCLPTVCRCMWWATSWTKSGTWDSSHSYRGMPRKSFLHHTSLQTRDHFCREFFFFFFELGEGMQVMLHFWYPGQENLSVLDARGGNSLVQSQQQTPLLCFWRKQKINK